MQKDYSEKNMAIAITGVSGIFPKSGDLDEFWENLVAERHLVTPLPEDRREIKISESNAGAKFYGGFIDDVDKFDCEFFEISPREAEMMDPQQRIALQVTWKAIEDAGYRVSDLSRQVTGVFWGVSNVDYSEITFKSGNKVIAYTSTGLTHGILPNRISYLLDLHGPSFPVNTACSSSLVAIHYAIKSIITGDCDIAIVGGINALLSPASYLSFNSAGMLSSDGKCKTFDRHAGGYVRGEGAGAVILKPLQKAVEDKDHIYAVIRGSSVNHGGKAKTLTSPNAYAQSALLYNAYVQAGVSPDTVSYIETHGTGTPLGDPIEITALQRAFRKLEKHFGVSKRLEQYCGLGSVKTNIGHLESAAGIAGLIKIILAMKHHILPASIHFSALNPHIRLVDSPFYVVDKTKPWEPLSNSCGDAIPRRAGLSSFGFGGVNAHIVLEEFQLPAKKKAGHSKNRPVIFILSARNKERLAEYARKWVQFLGKQNLHEPNIDLRNLAFTLQLGRKPMEERLAAVVRSAEELREALENYCNRNSESNRSLFTGSISKTEKLSSLLSGDVNSEEYLTSLITAKDWAKLAELWTAGMDIDWQLLYSTPEPERVSLPSYPFAKRKCYLQYDIEKSFFSLEHDLSLLDKLAAHKKENYLNLNPASNSKVYQNESKATAEGTPEQFYYRPVWRKLGGLPSHVEINPSSDSGVITKRKVIVIYNEDSRALADAISLTHAADEVHQIPVDIFKNDYGFDASAVEKTALTLAPVDPSATPVVYFLGAIQSETGGDQDIYETYPESGVLSLFRLVKLLCEKVASTTLNFMVLTNNSCVILGGEQLMPLQAAFHGFAMTAAREFPRWRVRCIDINLLKEVDVHKIAYTLVNQGFKTGSMNPGYILFGLRNGEWYERSLVPTHLKSPDKILFRNEGIYLIVGGKGTIGLTVARHLLNKVKARVALLGRSEPTEAQKKRFQEFESSGGKIMYVQADVTDAISLRRGIELIEREWGPLHGVFHSAMDLSTCILKNMDETLFKKIIAPKINGSVTLYRALREKPLDFLCFFSSIQSFTGNIAQSAYAAGCSFQDAFAAYVNASGHFPAKVINWGYWSGDILTESERDDRARRELGFHSADELAAHLESLGFGMINGAEGVSAIEQVLNENLGQIVAVKADRIQQKQLGIAQEPEDDESFTPDKPALKETGLNTGHGIYEKSDSGRRQKVEKILTTIVSEILHIDSRSIDITQAFSEFGLDSLLVIEFTEKISRSLNITLNATGIFNYPSIKELAAYIADNFNLKLAEDFHSDLPGFVLNHGMSLDEVLENLFNKLASKEFSVDEAVKCLEWWYVKQG